MSTTPEAVGAEVARVFAGADTELRALRDKVEKSMDRWPLSLRAACFNNMPALGALSQRSATVDFHMARARIAADIFLVATAERRYDADPTAKAELEGLAAGWIRSTTAPSQMRLEVLNWLAERSDDKNVDVTLPRDAAGAKAGSKADDVYAARRQQIRPVK
jgi:hypothetical protein